METENYLKSLKQRYLKTRPSQGLLLNGRQSLLNQIAQSQKKPFFVWRRSFALAFGILLIFVGSLFGFYKITEASLPGDIFYPVKRFSEKVAERATGSNQTAIDNRAQEIVTLAKQEKVKAEALKETVKEYKQNVEQTRSEIEESGKTNAEFQQKLEEQHRRFDETAKEAPSTQEDIKDAQEVSNHADRGDED